MAKRIYGEEELLTTREESDNRQKGSVKEELTKEQSLSLPPWRCLLPPEALISRSIWERGFYCKNGSVKYRTSVDQALIPYKNMPFIYILVAFVTLFLILGALANAQHFKPGNWVALFALSFLVFLQPIINLRKYSLNPKVEINFDEKKLKERSIFNKEIPFTDVSYLHVYKQNNRQMKGTEIMLGATRNKNKEERDIYFGEMYFAAFHPWEEHDVEAVKSGIQCLLGKELEIKYSFD
jgi:hypothetical protein